MMEQQLRATLRECVDERSDLKARVRATDVVPPIHTHPIALVLAGVVIGCIITFIVLTLY